MPAPGSREAVIAEQMRLEPERHRCEVAHIAGWRTPEGAPDYERMRSYFDGVAAPREAGGRGPETAARLRQDVRARLRRGRR